MPWRKISTADCKFTPGELARLNNIQGATDGLAKRLADSVGEFIGAMNAAGYATTSDGYVPDQLRGHILARTTLLFLEDFSELKVMLTDARKKAGERAEEFLSQIAQRKAGAIEPPTAVTGKKGNWNSENRLVMRTHPTPTPAQQAGDANGYANTGAPGSAADSSSSSSGTVAGNNLDNTPGAIPIVDAVTGKIVYLRVKDGQIHTSES